MKKRETLIEERMANEGKYGNGLRFRKGLKTLAQFCSDFFTIL